MNHTTQYQSITTASCCSTLAGDPQQDAAAAVEVPDKFICPITLNIMSRPLCNRNGISYERSAILEWIEQNGTCPLTRQPLRPSQLIPNRPLEVQIKSFRMQHKALFENDNDDKTEDNTSIDDADEDSSEDDYDDISSRRFFGFLPVSEQIHEQVLQRHEQQPVRPRFFVSTVTERGESTFNQQASASNSSGATEESSRRKRRFFLFASRRSSLSRGTSSNALMTGTGVNQMSASALRYMLAQESSNH
eukprot:CAMPEP_0172439662 /NCGR_PEP_ID=MMETSP1065-20121228/576_1 /TAXON_ID=265537 /ORGANISM="Amphiprora paludosa, Strain CCMP125" /LENGTH=247 /DNA_ID=CAMNT_0013188375 /DNA_START=244 /DNA_END=987 /DNA_ORIENTATION=+